MRGMGCLRWPVRQRQRPLSSRLVDEAPRNGAPPVSKLRSSSSSSGKVLTWDEDATIVTFPAPAKDPPPPAEVGIQPSAVNLGSGSGDFCLEAKVTTTQQNAALMGKMMARELYGPQSSPRGGRKMLVIRDGRLCWEVAGKGQLQGATVVSDGREHKVAVAYSSEEDCFTLSVDGLSDGSGLRNIEDHCDCKWALGNSDRLPTWCADAANCRFDMATGTIADVRWNGKLLLTGLPSASSKPAYHDGQCVEYYSRTHRVWLCGSMVTKVTSARHGSELASYAVVLQGTRQRRSAVGLSSLRLPLEPAEPCEYYVELEDRWMRAQVCGAFLDTSRPTYELCLEDQAAGEPPVAARSELVRRRFPKDSRVLIYRGLSRGWVPGTVMAVPGSEECRQQNVVEDDEDEFEFGSPVMGAMASDITVLSTQSSGTVGPIAPPTSSRTDGPREYNWADIPVCEEGEETWRLVPSYLLRFHKDYLLQLSQEQAVVESVQQALDDLDNMSDPGIDGLDRSPERPPSKAPDRVVVDIPGFDDEAHFASPSWVAYEEVIEI